MATVNEISGLPEGSSWLSNDLISHGTQCTFSVPKRSKYSMQCGSVIWVPLAGEEPNWFHRKMQQLFFGFRWYRNGND